MGVLFRRVLVLSSAAVVVLPLLGALAPPASAASGPTVTGPKCAGSTDTLAWTPPAVNGLTGYQVVAQFSTIYDLPPNQTSLQVPIGFGDNHFDLFAVTTEGVSEFGAADVQGMQAPQPMQWDSYSDGKNMVGSGTATVVFLWQSESLFIDSGNDSADTVTVTASPGGDSITSAPVLEDHNLQVVDVFKGLKNGVTYTFTSVASNACGTSGFATSAPFTPEGAGAITCAVSGMPTQKVIVVQAQYGLAAIVVVPSVTADVDVPAFAVGTTSPVVVNVSSTAPGQKMSWSFVVADVNGHTLQCH